MTVRILTDAQLKIELDRCEYCEEKPCLHACPSHVSPADFIMAGRVGEPSDYGRAALEILAANPLGEVCGLVCPDRFCQAACVHAQLDGAIEIPSVQATLVHKARELGAIPESEPVEPNGRRVAVVGAGPAGLAAAALLARKGYRVDLFDEHERAGGAARLIPPERLPREVLDADIAWTLSQGAIEFHGGRRVEEPEALLEQGYDGVIVALGLTEPIRLGVPGEEATTMGLDFLREPEAHDFHGRVLIVGGGAVAVDCAVTARRRGAEQVELLCLERWDEMPLSAEERGELLEHRVEITGRSRLVAIEREGDRIAAVVTQRVSLPAGVDFRPDRVQPVEGTELRRADVDHVIYAIGARRSRPVPEREGVFAAGDFRTGPSTVVEAVASGKNAALELDAWLDGREQAVAEHRRSTARLPGLDRLPVSLETDFFGRKLRSPFLLSAAPPSDGYEQMKRAYEAGWAGGIMKTAFDGVPVHIPGEYMHVFDEETWGNSDNVSGHPLDRVCDEVRRLVAEYPDRLTGASTGGPVTGNDEADKAAWQSNTRKLEAAGAMVIEYSLSCPQGGDGTEGDIVAQSPSLTAKIVDWVMEVSDPEIPKLFKLTAAVTAIEPVMQAVREVLDRYPHKKAGVTLANTFPTLNFRKGSKERWEEGIVVGMSGRGVVPISYFTLSRAAATGVPISGNGGVMDYKAAAHFLALGVNTVQVCTIVMKHGYGVIRELESGLAHLMAARGISSVAELVGRAWPDPVTDFMDLSPVKKISAVRPELCIHCGNCARCPYLAIHLEDGLPVTDPSRCIGCSICVQKCPSGALYMRDRTPEEAAALREH